MIPKVIHYCWLSGDPYPASIQKCLDSWSRVLPDYEIVLWDLNRFKLEDSLWVKQAFEAKKYAFAADYIRLHALYNYGGIYLDSDVEVLKPFDDLLDLPYFIGRENTPDGIEAATMGCEKGMPLMQKMLERYIGRPFIKGDGSYDVETMPLVFRDCIKKYYKVNNISCIEDFKDDKDVINLFPVEFFSPKTWNKVTLDITDNTYSIHHFAASWYSGEDVMKAKMRKLLGPKMFGFFSSIYKKLR